MGPEKATAWLEFLGKLTATIIVFMFAIYAGFTLIKNAETWMPRIAVALESHTAATTQANNAVVTNTEELTRIGRESCKTLKYIAKQPDRDCEIRKVILGNTITP